MDSVKRDAMRKAVRSFYGQAVTQGCGSAGCCQEAAPQLSSIMGYGADELTAVPAGANLGMGCGNPQAIAMLQPGEVVLDLGSGAGFDAFLAARQVGEHGRVIGVDMTPEMIERARANTAASGYRNVEFRLGEIESLPVDDNSVDVVISNCVINLSPDKKRVFAEAYRVLKPGGRLAIADIVATAELPEQVTQDAGNFARCISGATPMADLGAMLQLAGFQEIRITKKRESADLIQAWQRNASLGNFILSATIEAEKPS